MAQMTISAEPDFTDLPDGDFVAGATITADIMTKLNHNAKFGAVRVEYIYMGFYQHGDTVPTPVSPVDGYAYSRTEVINIFNIYSTRKPLAAAGFVSGQAQPPVLDPTQQGNLYYWAVDIDDSTGIASITMSNYVQGGAETVTNNGVVKVYCVCQRQSVNVAS